MVQTTVARFYNLRKNVLGKVQTQLTFNDFKQSTMRSLDTKHVCIKFKIKDQKK